MLKIRYFTWLPRTLAALAPWMANFALKFEQFALSLGFTAAEITRVNNINATVQWLFAAKNAIEANGKGFNKFRDETLYVDKDDPAPLSPIVTIPDPPADMVWGIVDILENYVGRIKLANSYSDEIGAQLGILPIPKGNIVPENLEVKGEYTPAAGGFEMAVVVSNRGEADQSVLQLRVVGQEKWFNAKTFTGKGTSYTYEDAPEGQPIRMQARIQLMKNNQPYSNPSPAVYVTLNP